MFKSLYTSIVHPAAVGMLISSLALGSLGGCSTIKFSEHSDGPVEQMAYTATHSGVSIGINPLTTRDEAMKYFKVDLPSKNILAVYVKLENHGNSSVLFENKQCSLVGFQRDVNGQILRSDGPGTATAITGAVLLSLPLMFVGMKMMSDADHIKKNFVVNELKRQGVSPGQSASGFVYFKQPDDLSEESGAWLIHVKPTTMSGSPIGTFEYLINSKEE
jgi:hypothetical protein